MRTINGDGDGDDDGQQLARGDQIVDPVKTTCRPGADQFADQAQARQGGGPSPPLAWSSLGLQKLVVPTWSTLGLTPFVHQLRSPIPPHNHVKLD